MTDLKPNVFKDSDLDDCYSADSASYTSDEVIMEKILLLCKSELIPYYQNYGFVYGGKSRSKHGGFEWYEMNLLFNAE